MSDLIPSLLERHCLRLEDEKKRLQEELQHAQKCYSALAELLGEHVKVAEFQPHRFLRCVRVDFFMDEELALSQSAKRRGLLGLVWPTIREALYEALAANSLAETERAAIRRRVRPPVFPVPEREKLR